MARRERAVSVNPKMTALEQMAIQAVEAGLCVFNTYPFVRICVQKNSIADAKVRSNFGYLQAAKYQDGVNTYYYMRNPYPCDIAKGIDFFGSVICLYDWGQDVEFRLQKGLPL